MRTLGITDHDTFSGYDQAVAPARDAGIDLVCGIELSTKLHGKSVHLLGYFLGLDGMGDFREWVQELQVSRRDRNARLAKRLQELGFDVTIEEVEARGRGMAGASALRADHGGEGLRRELAAGVRRVSG